jgi:hypothetical protein
MFIFKRATGEPSLQETLNNEESISFTFNPLNLPSPPPSPPPIPNGRWASCLRPPPHPPSPPPTRGILCGDRLVSREIFSPRDRPIFIGIDFSRCPEKNGKYLDFSLIRVFLRTFSRIFKFLICGRYVDGVYSIQWLVLVMYATEPEFVNVLGAQESIIRNRYRQPM